MVVPAAMPAPLITVPTERRILETGIRRPGVRMIAGAAKIGRAHV